MSDGDPVSAGSVAGTRQGISDRLRRARADRPRMVAAVVYGVPVMVVVGLAQVGGIDVLSVVVNGIRRGGVYSLVALGIALVYKSTRVLNFAQGEFGTMAAFVAYIIMVGATGFGDIGVQPDVSKFWWASLVAIAAGGVVAVLVNVLVVQRLAEASETVALVATGGVALMFVAAEVVIFQAQPRPFPRYVTGSPCLGAPNAEGARIGLCPLSLGTVVSWQTIIVLGVLAVAGALLAIFFRTRVGVALLASAQEPFAAELSGVSVRAMSTLAWAAAGILGAVSGLLAGGEFTQLTPGLLTATFLIPGFTGALLGGITSPVGAVVGGLLVGVTVSFANSAQLTFGLGGLIPGPPSVATFVVLLAVLWFRPRGLLGEEA